MEALTNEFLNKKRCWRKRNSRLKNNRISRAYPSTKPEKVYYFIYINYYLNLSFILFMRNRL